MDLEKAKREWIGGVYAAIISSDKWSPQLISRWASEEFLLAKFFYFHLPFFDVIYGNLLKLRNDFKENE